MDKIKTWWQRHRPSKRRLIQVYAALLYNAHLTGFAEGSIYTGTLKNLCIPGLNCYSCPGAIGACPLGALQNALAASSTRAPAYVLGILLLFGLTLGRTICGFLCPFGLLQELLHKLPTPKLKKSRFTRRLTGIKYILLIVLVVLLPLWSAVKGMPLPAFCKYLCPAGTLEGAAALLSHPANAEKFSMLGALFTNKALLAIIIFTLCIFAYRAFCRFLCPLGALYSLFARLSLLGVQVEAPKCTACGACLAHCKMDIRAVGDRECIQCGECMDVCPTGAITWKNGKFYLPRNEIPGKSVVSRKKTALAWALALLVLGGTLIFVNQMKKAPATQPVGQADETPIGAEVGLRCPDFTVPLYSNAGSFSLADCLGKITVINFWATWCTPCCNELPSFQQLADRYPDDVAMVAIHSDLITDNVQAYIDQTGYTIPFALDTDGSVIASLGGELMLPQTVILDRDGHIVYNKVGSVTYNLLESLIRPYLNET